MQARCYKEQYCIGTWNVRSMNQGKLEVVKLEMARENINILDFQKSIYFCFIDYAKAFDCGSQETVENSERDGNPRTPDLPLEKSVCRSGSNS